MLILLTALHLIVCLFLILVVLLQTGKGADVAAAFGGSSSQTAFGARGAATLLTKLTTISAVLFMLTSFSLAFVANRSTGSVVTDDVVEESSPAAPGTQADQPATTPPAEGGDEVLPNPEPESETPPDSPEN